MNIRNAAIVLGIAAASLTAIPASASAPTPYLSGVVKQSVTTPCAQEDSANCFWDAGNSGNGVGHSFYSVRVGSKLCTIYTNRTYNRTHGYCSTI